MYRRLDDKVLVAGQIRPEDVAELAGSGITTIVNNRPDGEDPGQPESADIETAAKAAGLDYRHVPIARGMGPSDVEAMREAMHSAGDGKVFAFCRSGHRSTLAWALAKNEDGMEREEIARCVEGAGFSIDPIAHLL